MPKGVITFDELDKKTLEELPLLLEIIATTMSKMGDLLSEQFEEIESILNDKIVNKANWKISEKNYEDGVHKPLVEKIGRNSETVYPYYEINYSRKVFKGIDDKPENFFWCQLTFYFWDNKPIVLYSIVKANCNKYLGANMPITFYNVFENLENVAIEHPDSGDKNEHFKISTTDLSIESITETFEYFKTEFLMPYLENLKW